MRKLLFFEGKCKKLLTFGEKKMSEKLLNCEYFFHSQKAQQTGFYFFLLHPQRLKKQEFNLIVKSSNVDIAFKPPRL